MTGAPYREKKLAGIVKLRLTAAFDAQYGGFATDWSPVSWGSLDELFVNLTMPWWNRFGPVFAAEIRKRRVHHRFYSLWRWHLDEVCVRINGKTHYLWRAVDHEGEVVEVFVTKRRDRRAALEFLTRAMKRYGRPASIVTDRLPSYRAAMKVIGNEGCQETRRWLNNRAENSHQPFRRREGAMARFRDIKTLQTFTSVHASIHNHFNHQRHLNRRDIFKQGRAAALAEWRQLAV